MEELIVLLLILAAAWYVIKELFKTIHARSAKTPETTGAKPNFIWKNSLSGVVTMVGVVGVLFFIYAFGGSIILLIAFLALALAWFITQKANFTKKLSVGARIPIALLIAVGIVVVIGVVGESVDDMNRRSSNKYSTDEEAPMSVQEPDEQQLEATYEEQPQETNSSTNNEETTTREGNSQEPADVNTYTEPQPGVSSAYDPAISPEVQGTMNMTQGIIEQARRAAEDYHRRYGAGSANYSEISPGNQRIMDMVNGFANDNAAFDRRIREGDPTVWDDMEEYTSNLNARASSMEPGIASERIRTNVQQYRRALQYQRSGHQATVDADYYQQQGNYERAQQLRQQAQEYSESARQMIRGN